MSKPRHIVRILIVALICTTSPSTADPPKDAAAARAEMQQAFGFVPGFLNALPDALLPSAWGEMRSLQMNANTALTGKQKELIGLAVAAQVPCEYCVVAHTELAKLNGATKNELGEAVAMAALTRHWSTFFNGFLPDEARFRGDLAKAVETMKQVQAGKATPMKVIAIVDAKSAHDDIAQWYGPMGDIMKRFPPEAIASAWRGVKDLELGQTALDSKTKSLIAVAVSAQIPCRYCVIADTEFAKLAGASDREISEAVAMSALVRNLSTMVNGLQVDKAKFRQDIARMVKAAKQPTKENPGKAAKTPKEARR